MRIIDVIKSVPSQDGDGVKIARVANFDSHLLDPFLMIDELKSDDESDYIGGFPPHPHRGMETFTYMIKGGFEHRDQMGNKKVISAGHVQWMSTGFGVVHSEMPVAGNDGMHGFQIWVNMASKDKLRPAIYRDSIDTGLPVIDNATGASLRALAGAWSMGDAFTVSPLNQLSASAAIADLHLVAGGTATIDRSDYEQVLVYIHTGEINGYDAGHLLVLDSGTPITFSTGEQSGALVFSAHKLREPIAHMGPFVMNTQAELMQAVQDYQSGKFGHLE